MSWRYKHSVTKCFFYKPTTYTDWLAELSQQFQSSGSKVEFHWEIMASQQNTGDKKCWEDENDTFSDTSSQYILHSIGS